MSYDSEFFLAAFWITPALAVATIGPDGEILAFAIDRFEAWIFLALNPPD